MRTHKLKRRGLNFVGVVLIIIVLIAIVVIFMTSSMGPDGVAAHVDDYIQMYDNAGRPDADNAVPADPGPVAIIDYENNRIDILQDQLPRGNKAEFHPDVKTIAFVIRRSTGMPGAAVGAVAPVANVKGSYSITAVLYKPTGEYIGGHTIQRESVISGAGAEGELRAESDPQMLDWILEQVNG